jgi:23S rRNA (cytosine1962-C5)-methyltransferase
VREQNREGAAGELAVIYDRKDSFLAIGLFDPESPIRVRVLHAGKPVKLDATWWMQRLDASIQRRNFFDEHTTGYRLINGESDGWPGLVLDRYDSTLVLKLYTAAWFARLDEIVALIQEQLKPSRIVLRLSRNIQSAPDTPTGRARRSARVEIVEGYSDRAPRTRGDAPNQKPAPINDGDILLGDKPEAPITFVENGIRFEADVMRGQKTGFFLDQRENRRLVGELAKGRHVLNAFSFSGGFSLYAARGGAASVTDLDISKHALASAERNFKLNQSNESVARCRHELVQADVFEWLATNTKRKFDLIILDPPSLAKRESERAGAIHAYEKLTALGLSLLQRDGILVACSCSAHVTAEEFFAAVQRSAAKSGRKFKVLQTTHHAPDHPATFKEAEYLKGIHISLPSYS